MKIIRLGSLLAAASFCGCATFSSKGAGSWGREYSGVRCVGTEDYWAGLQTAMRGTQAIYTSVDFLFSAVFDTALLPFDLIVDGIAHASNGKNINPPPLCNDNTRPAIDG